MTNVEKLARDIRWFLIGAVGFALFQHFADWPTYPTDATDLSPGQRSGMYLYTDYGTGCQYLATPLSSLTPRLNAAGKQEGCR